MREDITKCWNASHLPAWSVVEAACNHLLSPLRDGEWGTQVSYMAQKAISYGLLDWGTDERARRGSKLA